MLANLRRIGFLLPAQTVRCINPDTLRNHSSCNQTSEKISKQEKPRQFIKKGPGLEFFLYNNPPKDKLKELSTDKPEKIPYLKEDVTNGAGRKG